MEDNGNWNCYYVSLKIVILCLAEERNAYSFGTTWENDDIINFFGWTMCLIAINIFNVTVTHALKKINFPFTLLTCCQEETDNIRTQETALFEKVFQVRSFSQESDLVINTPSMRLCQQNNRKTLFLNVRRATSIYLVMCVILKSLHPKERNRKGSLIWITSARTVQLVCRRHSFFKCN